MVGVSAIIAIEARRSAVGHDDQIKVAIVIDVGVRGTSPDNRSREIGAHSANRLDKLPLPDVAKQVWSLRVGDAVLGDGKVIVDVTVGGKDIEPAVKVVIEK